MYLWPQMINDKFRMMCIWKINHITGKKCRGKVRMRIRFQCVCYVTHQTFSNKRNECYSLINFQNYSGRLWHFCSFSDKNERSFAPIYFYLFGSQLLKCTCAIHTHYKKLYRHRSSRILITSEWHDACCLQIENTVLRRVRSVCTCWKVPYTWEQIFVRAQDIISFCGGCEIGALVAYFIRKIV